MKHEWRKAAMNGSRAARGILGVASLGVLLAGCNGLGNPLGDFKGFGSFSGISLGYDGTIQRGYVADPRTIEALRPGQAAEQVLAQLGTPSTTSTVGGDAWYYISQTVTRPVAFMPDRITDQRVLAVYFKGKKLERVANYGLQDGQLFDYISRTTPVAGGDTSFLQNMIKGILKFG